ncbi:hypothetical protein PBOI14_37060 [Pseudomonas sp. Boi14]|nr:hypothetical protein PBOI14_37060 [Pseudomonas sp. Boi14]
MGLGAGDGERMGFAQAFFLHRQEGELPGLERKAPALGNQLQVQGVLLHPDRRHLVFAGLGHQGVEQQLVQGAEHAEDAEQSQPDTRGRIQGDGRFEAQPVQDDDQEQRAGELVPPAPLAVGNVAVQCQQHDQAQGHVAQLADQARPVFGQFEDRHAVPFIQVGLEHQVVAGECQGPDAQPLVRLVDPVKAAEQPFDPAQRLASRQDIAM